MRPDVLIVADAPQPTPVACELVTAARRVAGPAQGHIGALLWGGEDGAIDAWRALGVEGIYRLRCEAAEDLLPETQLLAAAEAARRASPALVLFAHTPAAAEIAPRLAFRLGGSVATGCVDVALDRGRLRCTRPCYGGLAREEDEFAIAPLVATVRSGAFERSQALAEPTAPPEVIDLGDAAAYPARARRIERRVEHEQGKRLEDARVIVAGGRGLEGSQGFEVLAALAHALDGAVGSSRVPCDLGWCPHSWQIGLTGKTVTPELYIAVGISGAGHHMAGCGNAKVIVAVNSDPDAAIFQDARFGVVGDYREVLPAMTELLTTGRSTTGSPAGR